MVLFITQLLISCEMKRLITIYPEENVAESKFKMFNRREYNKNKNTSNFNSTGIYHILGRVTH